MAARSFKMFFWILLVIGPELLCAQANTLEGTWKAVVAGGPTVRKFSFHVTGNSFSGAVGGHSFTNGKIENGRLSFSTNQQYYTGVISGDHLDLTEEFHFTG